MNSKNTVNRMETLFGTHPNFESFLRRAGPRVDEASESSDDEDEEDPEQMRADDLQREERKKAGIPTLELDALPSTIAQKMVFL